MNVRRVVVAWSEPNNLGGLVALCRGIAHSSAKGKNVHTLRTDFLGTRKTNTANGISEIRINHESEGLSLDCRIEVSPCSDEFPSLSSLPTESPTERSTKRTLESFYQWAKAVDSEYPHVMCGTFESEKPIGSFETVDATGIIGFLDEPTPVAGLFPKMLAPTPHLISRLHGRVDTLHPTLFSGSDLAKKIAQVGIDCGFGSSTSVASFKLVNVVHLTMNTHLESTFVNKCRENDLLI